MTIDYSSQLIELGVRLGEIAMKNTAGYITHKIETAKAKKDDKETIRILEEIINDLIKCHAHSWLQSWVSGKFYML